MISSILSRFGYVRIPKEAVRLSIAQEVFLEKLKDLQGDCEPVFDHYIKSQKLITWFLRQGSVLWDDKFYK